MHHCSYCKKSYNNITWYEKHLLSCKIKKRYTRRNTPQTVYAMFLYSEWWETYYLKKNLTFNEFIKLKEYNLFMDLAKFFIDTDIKDGSDYLIWVTTKKIPSKHWISKDTYKSFSDEFIDRESSEDAFDRFITHIEEWAKNREENWYQYLDLATNTRIVNDIEKNKISPWIFLSISQAKFRIRALPDEYFDIISDSINLDYWDRKISLNMPSVSSLNGIWQEIQEECK